MDTLDEIIREIMEDPETVLSAEAKNALHGATSSHPWCRGKALGERVLEVRFATAGRAIHATLRHRLERLSAQQQEV